mgnify:FL=1
MTSSPPEGATVTEGVVLAHDYATQRGGAERVALWLARAFPGSPMYTTLYDPADTFPEFGALQLRTTPLNRVATLRRHHRLALPLLAPAITSQHIEADVLVASSSGWAHGYRGAKRTIVYCHAPARWLYQRDRYLGGRLGDAVAHRARTAAARAVLSSLSPALKRWDAAAARRADVYLANSTVTQRALLETYGITAEVLPPPPSLVPAGGEREVAGVGDGFLLCVARLLPYKNVDAIISAIQLLGDRQLVVVGDGPDRGRLQSLARVSGHGVKMLGRVDDDELRWLYRHTAALVAASHEDYGLSPLEAGAFGRPSVVLRAGGYLDTVVDGVNGIFFDSTDAVAIAAAIEQVLLQTWDAEQVSAHAARFSPSRFISQLQRVVAGVAHDGGGR